MLQEKELLRINQDTILYSASLLFFSCLQCVVEVGASNIILDNREQEIEVEQNESTTNDAITTMGTMATEEIGSLEVAFLYDAPMREMTVCIIIP